MACGVRVCNFLKARLAPADRWASVAREIAAFLRCNVKFTVPEPPVRLHRAVQPLPSVFTAGMHWLDGMFLDEWRSGDMKGYVT